VWLPSASDTDVLDALSSLQPHVIVDLSSYTVLSRPNVVASAPACFKVNAVNYPSTMGGIFEDLLLTDRVSSPPEANLFYGEKLLVMPGSGFPAFFADGAGELVPMCMRMSLMRDCSSGISRDNSRLCSSADGDSSLASLVATPPPSAATFPTLLLNFIRSPSSSPLDKAAFLFISLTSLRASLLATRQFNGTDLFHLSEGYLRELAQDCALADRGRACLKEFMAIVGEFMEGDTSNTWPRPMFDMQFLNPQRSPPPPPSSDTATPLHAIEIALHLLRCNLSREADANHAANFISPR
jgi:hypothetical protein